MHNNTNDNNNNSNNNFDTHSSNGNYHDDNMCIYIYRYCVLRVYMRIYFLNIAI